MPSRSEADARRSVRFEHNASRVVFDPEMSSFVVTWSKCNAPIGERMTARKDPMRWIPSVSAITTLYDRGCVNSDQVVSAAAAVGRAFDAGDREGLDTDGAKKAAELVRDLATMCVDSSSPSVSRDVGQAMRRLLDEIAAVRFMNTPISEEDAEKTAKSLEKAAMECLAEPGFCAWSPHAMRRRFLYCLNRKERTSVAYTVVALLFDSGACPLLSLSDRRTIRMLGLSESGMERAFGLGTVGAFVHFVLDKMREMKANGRNTFGTQLTQQQLADSIQVPDDINKSINI